MRAVTTEQAAARLRAHISAPNDRGCILWTGPLDPGGYGYISCGKRFGKTAHRVAWVISHGDVPDGLWVLHRCDNRACVNVGHLYVGTPKQNASDCHKRGRWAWGSRCGTSKLSDFDVAWIRALLGAGCSPRKIGPVFGVHHQTIFSIKYGRTWSRKPGLAPYARSAGAWKVSS